MSVTWPPVGPTSVKNTIPAYPYVQYQGDDNVGAFFDAYNIYAQAYVDWFNNLDFPIYTKAPVVDTLLDWVAKCIYGIVRPALTAKTGTPPQGPVNSFTVNSLPANAYRPGLPNTYTVTSDDTFRRIITWAFYKGDGKAVTPIWLKRRINRFLYGINGTDILNDTAYNISVAPTGFKAWTITLPTSDESKLFKLAVEAGVLELPFQITWTVTLV